MKTKKTSQALAITLIVLLSIFASTAFLHLKGMRGRLESKLSLITQINQDLKNQKEELIHEIKMLQLEKQNQFYDQVEKCDERMSRSIPTITQKHCPKMSCPVELCKKPEKRSMKNIENYRTHYLVTQ